MHRLHSQYRGINGFGFHRLVYSTQCRGISWRSSVDQCANHDFMSRATTDVNNANHFIVCGWKVDVVKFNGRSNIFYDRCTWGASRGGVHKMKLTWSVLSAGLDKVTNNSLTAVEYFFKKRINIKKKKIRYKYVCYSSEIRGFYK